MRAKRLAGDAAGGGAGSRGDQARRPRIRRRQRSPHRLGEGLDSVRPADRPERIRRGVRREGALAWRT